MPKVTQNRILGTDGATIKIGKTADTVVDFLTKFDALRYCQATEKVKGDDGKVTVKPLYNADGTPKMIARPRSGYTQYFNNDGFTNPISPESLSPQGIGKLMAKLIQVSQVLIRAGGKTADEMKDVLEGIAAYQLVAADEVDKTAEHSEMDEALKTLTKAAGGDVNAAQEKLAKFLASKGMTAPAPTLVAEVDTVLTEPTVTVAEAAEAVATATEVEQDTVDNGDNDTVDNVDVDALVDAGEVEPTETVDETQTVVDETVEPNETTEDIGEPVAVETVSLDDNQNQ